MRGSLIAIVLLVVVQIVFFQPDSKIKNNDAKVNAFVEDKFIVTIDPGHGGYDTGATAIDGAFEKDINLEIALMVGTLLEEKDIVVYYTREDDNTDFANMDNEKDLDYRLQYAADKESDLLISIHCNSSDYGEFFGFETWIDYDDEDALMIGEAILANFENLGFSDNRGFGDGKSNLHLIAYATMPACLVEIGFIDNKVDNDFIKTTKGKEEIAEAIAKAIIEQQWDKK